MSSDFKSALKDTADICKFELWLRFYFTKEEEGQELKLEVPEDIMEHIRKEYPQLADMAEKMNGNAISPEKSQQTLTKHISHRLDGEKYEPAMMPGVLNSKSFEVEMSAFHMWVNAHEDQLEEKVYDFKEWMEFFEAWKRTEKGQNTLSRLHTTADAENVPQQ